MAGSDRTVRSDLALVPPPLLDNDLGYYEGPEIFAGQQFVLLLAIEGLDAAILPGTARFNDHSLPLFQSRAPKKDQRLERICPQWDRPK